MSLSQSLREVDFLRIVHFSKWTLREKDIATNEHFTIEPTSGCIPLLILGPVDIGQLNRVKLELYPRSDQKIFRLGIVYFIILSQLKITFSLITDYDEPTTKSTEEKPRVELRAVFINCASEDPTVSPDNEATRFEREELFKHSVLKDCVKKLALTVKVTSETEYSGDEYLPIEHVFDGPSKKHIRLLDPYVLRLRRDIPLQAYKLQMLETVRGVLMNSGGHTLGEKHTEESWKRFHRDLAYASEGNDSSEALVNTRTVAISTGSLQLQSPLLTTTESIARDLRDCERNVCPSLNDSFNERYKRSEHNIVVETVTDENTKWDSKEHFHRLVERDRKKHSNHFDDGEAHESPNHKPVKPNHKKEIVDSKRTAGKVSPRKAHRSKLKNTDEKLKGETELQEDSNSPNGVTNVSPIHSSNEKKAKIKLKKLEHNNHHSNEKDYSLYEIGAPEIWYTVHVQLFEKLSSPDGKTVWNDLTKGDQASVSSHTPEWVGQDMNVRYRATKWVPREEFTLPSTRLCLLVPVEQNQNPEAVEENKTTYSGELGYIVVPEDDILGLRDEDVTARNESSLESETSATTSERSERKYRKVMVRMSRAIVTGYEELLNIASRGADKYLTLTHKRPHSAQIDLEARADDNELVRIGSSGRISIAVSDSTRKTRTILNLQVGNTGLAAARFRVVARDLDPPLSDLGKDKDLTTAGPILIPPRHTRSLRLELPIEIPVDVVHCSVSLVNDDDVSVAVRDVTIKKKDRCFCVWHCDCVCLSDDPKLMCHDMDESAQKAAGLSIRDRSRCARSVCYVDVVSLNLFVVFTGVIFTLLLLGLIKAVVGLICRPVGIWGLHQLLQTPRKLECYYEKSLRNRTVVYDKDCWPVHPDTCKRTVRVVSLPMELFLNTIFFISLPCLIMYDVVRNCISKFSSKSKDSCVMAHQIKTNKCYSTHDMQAVMLRRRRRRDRLRRWMTPQAQELSTELWQKSFKERFLQPLLREKRSCDGACNPNATQDSLPDSEQDDTDYVLTQMQKSRESLARSQKKLCDLDPSALVSSANKDKNKGDNN